MYSEKDRLRTDENNADHKAKQDTSRQSPEKVLIIHTGGTIGMVYNEHGLLDTSKDLLKKKVLSIETLNSSKDFENPVFKSKYGSFRYDFFDLDPLIDSSDMDHKYYTNLINCIAQNYDKYSTFIIFHGTDTMAYTTPMLNLFIENLSKPILITGSAYSIFEMTEHSDAYENIVSTFNYACKIRSPGVYLSFCRKLFDSKSVKKFSSVINDMFFFRTCLCVSPDNLPKSLTTESTSQLKVRFLTPEKIKLASLYITPLDHINVYDRVMLSKDEFLLIHGYGNGNIPVCNKILELVKRHSAIGGISIVVSQCPDSYVKPLYSSWAQLNKLGVISSGNMSVEFLTSKLSYLTAKNVPWNMMELLLFISFDCDDYFALNPKDFCKIALKILERSGHIENFEKSKNKVLTQVEREMMLTHIHHEELIKISANPLLYFLVFKQKHQSLQLETIKKIDSLIVRSIFLLFEVMTASKFLFN